MTVQSASPRTVLPAAEPEAESGVLQHIVFPTGLFGFPECREFLLTATGRPGFYWLRSCEHQPLVFLLADPFVFFPGYTVDLSDGDVAGLDSRDPSELAVLAIVTLPRAPGEPLTANLQGPVVLNLGRRVGRQIVLTDRDFGLRSEFRVEAADAA